jgi:aminopeptidase
MFTEKQLSRYADVLLWGLQTARNRKPAKNDLVLLRFDLAAVRLAEILYAKLLKAGVHPLLRMNPTASMQHSYYALANAKQLVYMPPIGKAAVAKKKLRDLMEKRETQGKFSWTLCIFPTTGLAKHARISQKSYSAQIVRACFLNSKSPVAEWQRIYKEAQAIKQWLNRLPLAYLTWRKQKMGRHIRTQYPQF